MGLFDRLFNRKAPTGGAAEPAEKQKPTPAPAAPAKSVSTAASASAPAEPKPDPAPAAEVAKAVVAEEAPADEVAAPVQKAVPEAAISPEMLQRKLDRYFARLREVYPDGEIVRLNTGHKKLAERGAQLRKLTGEEGDLDAFFARGGFTYRRSNGGRPPLELRDVSAIGERVHALYPQGTPTVLALRQADGRLYLDLRAIARRENVTVGQWLTAHGLMQSDSTAAAPTAESLS